MNIKLFLFIGLAIIFKPDSFSQNRINVIIPTAEEEANYVWRNLQDMAFFEKHNYTVSLPEGTLIDTLVAKSKSNRLSPKDYESLETFMKTNVYQKSDYQKGYEKIIKQSDLINKMVNQLSNCKHKWNFKTFDLYDVNLTLYGTGGSYNPDNGSIILFTRSDGTFKQNKNPANTLIHEITHIGIEASIIAKYQVGHALKERIVDKFVILNFEELLPEYRIQNMGDTRIDPFLVKKEDLENLDLIVEKFLNDHH